MWPFDAWRPADAGWDALVLLRRRTVERWVRSGGAWSRAALQPLPQEGPLSTDLLAAALRALHAEGAWRGKVGLLAESHALPVTLVDLGTGPTLWGRAQVEALARHRLGDAHGPAGAEGLPWDVRVSHEAGDRYAVAFGVRPPWLQAVAAAGEQAGVRWQAVLPAWAWGFQRLRAALGAAGHGGWWAWGEQDRMLLARVAQGRVVGLHPAVKQGLAPADLLRAVAAESVRQGLGGKVDRVLVSGWDGPAAAFAGTPGVVWLPVAAQSGAARPEVLA